MALLLHYSIYGPYSSLSRDRCCEKLNPPLAMRQLEYPSAHLLTASYIPKRTD